MALSLNSFICRLKDSRLVKDSFYATFGNGLGNALLLLAGILIARLLGRDLYGEYGMVKTTMFYIATFSTFGLGTTITKFIAEYLQKDISQVGSIVRASIRITLATSGLLSLLLLVFADILADFINTPQLAAPFRFLAVIILCRALNTLGAGILAGFKEFKLLGRNNILAGMVMLAASVPLTYYFSLYGALAALLLSQLLLAFLNLQGVRNRETFIYQKDNSGFEKQLIIFSYPFALTELIYTFSSWGVNLMIAKYASIGDLGLYTACTQWNTIILFFPSLLQSVMLSYLSTAFVESRDRHKKMFQLLFVINFVCVFIPFAIVFLFASLIEQFYGITFHGMSVVMRILIISTLLTCMQRVLQQNFLSEGKKWTLFVLRGLHNISQLCMVFLVLKLTSGANAAYNLALLHVSLNIFITILYIIAHLATERNLAKTNSK